MEGLKGQTFSRQNLVPEISGKTFQRQFRAFTKCPASEVCSRTFCSPRLMPLATVSSASCSLCAQCQSGFLRISAVCPLTIPQRGFGWAPGPNPTGNPPLGAMGQCKRLVRHLQPPSRPPVQANFFFPKGPPRQRQGSSVRCPGLSSCLSSPLAACRASPSPAQSATALLAQSARSSPYRTISRAAASSTSGTSLSVGSVAANRIAAPARRARDSSGRRPQPNVRSKRR